MARRRAVRYRSRRARQRRAGRGADHPRAGRAGAPARHRRPPDAPRRGRAGARRAGAVRRRSTVGQALGHDVVPLLGFRARGLGARREPRAPPHRGDARPRMGSAGTRVLLGGPGPRRRRPRRARPAPAPPGRGRGTGRRAVLRRRRGGVQPVVPAVPAVAARIARHRRRRSPVRPGPRRRGAGRPRRRGAALRLRRARRGDAHPPGARPAPRTHPARARGCPRRRRRRGAARRRASSPRRRARSTGRRWHAPRGRHRPRPHRHGVAVADPRDRAQVRPHVLVGRGAARRRPGAPLRRLAGPAVRVGPPARARAVRPHRREGRRRPVDPRRWAVGRGRHEPAVR